jgi:hypothetical protein
MPKDASKNVDRYKVRGGDINEFEYHQNQEQFVATKGTKSSKKTGSGVTKGATAKKLAARKAAAKK